MWAALQVDVIMQFNISWVDVIMQFNISWAGLKIDLANAGIKID